MATALSLFVNAANGKQLRLTAAGFEHQFRGQETCDQLYGALCRDRTTPQAPVRSKLTSEATLYQAFRVVCTHYTGHRQQEALCARVIGFHFLMVHTAGMVLEGWAQDDPREEKSILLPKAVVYAVASVELLHGVPLEENSFRRVIAAMAKEHTTGS